MKKIGNKKPGSEGIILYGRHAVTAALENPQRKIFKLVCTPEQVSGLQRRFPDVRIVAAEKKEIDRLLPAEAVHQGLALYCSPLPPVALEDICAAADQSGQARILILDQVTDPHNIGAIIRSCAAFGAQAVIVQDKNSPEESGAMAKAAAGTMELLPVVRTINLARAIETLKKHGFWIIGMDSHAKTQVSQMDKGGKLAVVMGSEGAGMRRLVEESCDMTVRLPIAAKVESLNVSTAAAVILYELAKD